MKYIEILKFKGKTMIPKTVDPSIDIRPKTCIERASNSRFCINILPTHKSDQKKIYFLKGDYMLNYNITLVHSKGLLFFFNAHTCQHGDSFNNL